MQCRLCSRESNLQHSHIIPEWCFKPLYNIQLDKKHPFYEYTTDRPARLRYHQKGLREYLLCRDCEQKRSSWEKYASRVLYADDTDIVGLSIVPDGRHLIIEGVNYELFKLFQLSVLWMSSVAKQEFFSEVRLGRHEDIIRRMLLEGDPGNSDRYGCIMCLLMKNEKEPLDQLIGGPRACSFEGHRWYQFIFAGVEWNYVVSSHKKDSVGRQGFLKESGKMLLPFIAAGNAPLIRRLAQIDFR